MNDLERWQKKQDLRQQWLTLDNALAEAFTVLGRTADAYDAFLGALISEPPPPPTVKILGSASGETGKDIAFTVAVANTSAIEWNFGDGTIVPTATSLLHTFATPGSYTVTVTVTDAYGRTASDSLTIVVTVPVPPPPPPPAPGDPLLISAQRLAELRDKVMANAPQWAAFQKVLDANLGIPIAGGQVGANISAMMSNYALAACITESDAYCDKACACLKSMLRDYMSANTNILEFIARGDGLTTAFALPAGRSIVPKSFGCQLSAITHRATIRRPNADTDGYGIGLNCIKISNTADGPEDYKQGTDYVVDYEDQISGAVPGVIRWLTANRPLANATYYVTTAIDGGVVQAATAYTYTDTTITFKTPPRADQAVLIQCCYHEAGGLRYQQTQSLDGGFSSIYRDTGYGSRFFGKHISLMLEWIGDRIPRPLFDEAVAMLVRWADYLAANGYHYGSAKGGGHPASNYFQGTLCSQTATALFLERMGHPAAADLLADTLRVWSTALLPAYRPPVPDSLLGTMFGGFMPEGWNYGALGCQNLCLAALMLKQRGKVVAAEEAAWADQVVTCLIHARPTPGKVYSGGEFFAGMDPAPFPAPARNLSSILSQIAATKGDYARGLVGEPSGAVSDWCDLIFYDLAPPTSPWKTKEPLHYFAAGTGLLFARSDWSDNPVWVALQCGNQALTNHQSLKPGHLQIARGPDMLLVNMPAIVNTAPAFLSDCGNVVAVDSNGDKDARGMLIQAKPWIMSPDPYSGLWDLDVGYRQPPEMHDDYVYAWCDYQGAYGWSNSSRAVRHNNPTTRLWREVIFVRPNIVIVRDTVATLEAEYPKQTRWHTRNPVAMGINAWHASAGNSALACDVFADVPLKTTTMPTPYGAPPVQRVITEPVTPVQSATYVTVFQVVGLTEATVAPTYHGNGSLGPTIGVNGKTIVLGPTPGTVSVS